MSDFERETQEIIERKKLIAAEEFHIDLREKKAAEEKVRLEQQTREQELLRRLEKEKEIYQRLKRTAESGMETIGKATWGKRRFDKRFENYTDISSLRDFEIASWEINVGVKGPMAETIDAYTLWLCRGRSEDQKPWFCPVYFKKEERHFPADESGLRESLKLLAETGPDRRVIWTSGGRWQY